MTNSQSFGPTVPTDSCSPCFPHEDFKADEKEHTIKAFIAVIDKPNSEIAEMMWQIKLTGEHRKKENEKFQISAADQCAT